MICMSLLCTWDGQKHTSDSAAHLARYRFFAQGIQYGIKKYRQYTAAMVRIVTKEKNAVYNALMKDFEWTAHEQAGHTVSLAERVYGRSSNGRIGMGYYDVRRYKAWCNLWSRHLGLQGLISEHKTLQQQWKPGFEDRVLALLSNHFRSTINMHGTKTVTRELRLHRKIQ